ncbi:ribonucleoside-diphosphate reductase class II [Thermoanaerobacter sp. YS13]|uniref:adenosylcobalamin-dependent ribonucleoside-diphosphate reductase n=1 Tax=Thermoanaerobacter sp. YS13 TaxID=1511746 RepID=UPI00057557A8|nr:adenosylcobalamin-dependent ribonucleoside-diphosphate reductase [Thermoanaerobacter sp. YS13]KHO61941.1 ribonucleoside-diphosphate reductase class II [Thermoanaerobacter sp. YS13]
MLPIWNEQREKVFLDRYALKDKEGKPIEKKPEEMFRRVAKAIATNKREEEMFYKVMSEWKFIPGGRILAGAGTGREVTYFNCFVIPVEANDPKKGNDSRAAIMDTIAKMLEINSRGGGVGINWSTLRPRGAYVKGVGGTSSGAVSWMLAANEVATQVEQGGSRRAALMFMLWDWHPDIEEFIKVKKDLTKMQQANLSVAVSDAFMEAVAHDKVWKLEFPDTSHPNYDAEWRGDLTEWKSKGYPTIVYKEIPARELWNKIVTAAWESAEPGVVFLERYNKFSNTYYVAKIISTNPCGELGLEPYGVCNLGAINLVAFVENGKINFTDLEETVKVAVRFLDNVLDSGAYVLPQNKEMAQKLRKIGLGIMGLADALILMDLKYGSENALKVTEQIASTIRNAAYKASVELAKERGAFPEFVVEKYLKSQFVKSLPNEIREEIATYGIRNATILTQAPTGTTSILTGVSSGIEPNFAKEYIRQDRTGTHTIKHWLADYPAFVSAHEITPEEHVKMQAVLQKYVDSSISKTINLPNSATIDDIDKIYRLAYELGCKGITVYRDGSREGVLVTDIKSKEKTQITERPPVLKGVTKRIETPLGRAYVTINFIDEKPFEVFVNIGRAGSDVAAFTEAIARLISLALRGGVAIEEITEQLIGIGGATAIGFGENRVMSVPDAIGKALRNGYQPKNNGNGIKSSTTHVDICPACGMATFVYTEGCKTCLNCGYSEC